MISFQHVVLLEMISFKNIFDTVTQMVHSCCPLVTGTSGGLIKVIKIELIPICHKLAISFSAVSTGLIKLKLSALLYPQVQRQVIPLQSTEQGKHVHY